MSSESLKAVSPEGGFDGIRKLSMAVSR